MSWLSSVTTALRPEQPRLVTATQSLLPGSQLQDGQEHLAPTSQEVRRCWRVMNGWAVVTEVIYNLQGHCHPQDTHPKANRPPVLGAVTSSPAPEPRPQGR